MLVVNYCSCKHGKLSHSKNMKSIQNLFDLSNQLKTNEKRAFRFDYLLIKTGLNEFREIKPSIRSLKKIS